MVFSGPSMIPIVYLPLPAIVFAVSTVSVGVACSRRATPDGLLPVKWVQRSGQGQGTSRNPSHLVPFMNGERVGLGGPGTALGSYLRLVPSGRCLGGGLPRLECEPFPTRVRGDRQSGWRRRLVRTADWIGAEFGTDRLEDGFLCMCEYLFIIFRMKTVKYYYLGNY